MITHEDLYEVLGVRHNATQAKIKKAHRSLVVIYHPDVKGSGDVERFRRIDVAYKVLRDPKKRALYDETGTYNLASVQTEMQQVVTVMVQLYDKLLASGKAFDKRVSVIDLMRKIVTNTISGLKIDIDKSEDQMGRLIDLRRTISREGDGENLFTQTTDRHLEKISARVTELQAQVHTLSLVQEELGNYSSFARVTRAVQVVWMPTGSSTSTSTGW